MEELLASLSSGVVPSVEVSKGGEGGMSYLFEFTLRIWLKLDLGLRLQMSSAGGEEEGRAWDNVIV